VVLLLLTGLGDWPILSVQSRKSRVADRPSGAVATKRSNVGARKAIVAGRDRVTTGGAPGMDQTSPGAGREISSCGV
jgi:hypothetical protein